MRLKIQIDFGVGDVMVPGPRMIEYPVLLAGDTVHLLAYPIESSIAEKLQAMVALGNANSRMKDGKLELAREIEGFVRRMPAPLTEREWIERAMGERIRRRPQQLELANSR